MIKQLKEAGKHLEESLILDWFVQLANGVRYIHDRYETIAPVILLGSHTQYYHTVISDLNVS